MIARKYNRRIEIYSLTDVNDGFGGFTTTEAFVCKQWANIKSKQALHTTDNGKVLNTVYLVVTIRNRYDMTWNTKQNFILFNGKKYVIDSIVNSDLNDIDLVLNCSEFNG